MTFDLSTEQEEARDRARAFAVEHVQPRATEIDRSSTIPEELTRQIADLIDAADPTAMVVAIEEIAAVSAAVAVSAGDRAKGTRTLELSGLRGATLSGETSRTHLSLAAVALGVGRAARDAARRSPVRPAPTPAART